MDRFLIISLLLVGICTATYAQNPFEKIILRTDTASYNYTSELDEPLNFKYTKPNEVLEVYLDLNNSFADYTVEIISSGDFAIVDSVIAFTPRERQFKVRFKNIPESALLKFNLRFLRDSTAFIQPIELQPYTDTYVEFYPSTEELYVGEEKILQLTTNDLNNIVIDSRWTEGLPINYRLTRQGQQLRIHLQANELGRQRLNAQIKLKKPVMSNGDLAYNLPEIEQTFTVKKGRLSFLQIDRQEITPKDDTKEPIEIQIDNDPNLQLNKTYRMENQEERGGALIAELFTKNRLNNDKILATLRIYSYHRKSEGYLYLKDGDKPLFVTNVDITPKTSISEILIQREGKDWESSQTVYPGESIMVRLKGEGLHKASFSFQGAEKLELDSLVRNENLTDFRLKIPRDIATKSIEIFNNDKATGSKLSVKEYQKPRDFDFIMLDLAGKNYTVDKINKPIFFSEVLTDLIINFNANKIDQDEFYGKQYITIDIKVSNKQGQLIELYKMEDLVICPSLNSTRGKFYERDECSNLAFNINSFLGKKTYDLDEWSRIDIDVKHDSEKYDQKGEKKRIQIYLKRDYNFDLDVSFPAGLLIFEEDSDVSNFGGVSFAMLAQFSFYKPGRIAEYRPYKIGAGFIAIDAFNFAENNERQDIGLVIIGSIYPTSSDRKLTFPLFAGFGWKIQNQKPFFLLGPGIRVRL